MKRLQAFIAAIIITGLVAAGMLVIGLNAFFNTNAVQASDLPTSVAANTPAGSNSTNTQSIAGGPTSTSAADQAKLAQLQNLVAQYQAREQQYHAREKQYQDQLNQAATQLQQANSQLQQYQQILMALQQRGIIRIGSDGSVQLGRFGFGGDDGG